MFVLALLCCLTVNASAQEDSSRSSASQLFSRRDAALAGAFLVGTLAATPGDRYFAKLLQDSSNQSDPLIRLMSTDVSIFGRPGLLVIGSSLFVVGKIARKRGVAHFGLHATEAMLITEVVNGTLKIAAGRARPRENIDRPYDFSFGRGLKKKQDRSFASSHTADAFAFASVATEEVNRRYPHARWCVRGDWCVPPAWVVGAVAYSGAGVIGLTRMYNNEHWGSDVMMGAAIGTFSGLKVVQYNHLHSPTRLDRWLLSVSPLPMPRGGLAVGWSVAPPF